jgi:3-keto-disaccharide hydrolase
MKRMKTILLFFATILVSFSIMSCTGETLTEPVQNTDISEFIGQWTIDIQGGGVGWLEVRQEDKYLDADLLWWGGSVLPVSNVYLSNNRYLIVTRNNNIVRTKDAKDLPLRSQVITNWLELTRDGDKIVGFLMNPRRDGSGVDSVPMVGTKLPAPPPAPDLASIKFGEPVTLFNGKDLTGWRLINEENANGYSAIDGVLDVNPAQVEGEDHIHYGNLRTDAVFEDFNIKLEVNIPAGSNSGVYLRGMYEIQVFDSYKKELDSHNMGGVYSRITPTVNAEKPAGTWQTLDITLCDRHATVILNGVKIIDNQPVYGPTGGAIISDVFAPGPIYLQGDHGKVQYRNIVLTPIVK